MKQIQLFFSAGVLFILASNRALAETDPVLLGKFPLRPEENLFSVVAPWPPRDLPVGALRVDTELRFEEVFHRLQPPWTASESPSSCSDRGLDKSFQKAADNGSHRPWTSGFGDQLTLALQARPSEEASGRATLAYQTDYADRLWLPINDEHRMAIEGRRLRVIDGELSYRKKNFSLRGFEGVGHGGWDDRGDLFGLYPEQWEIDKYRNYTGRKVPRGGELIYASPIGKFTLVGGGELIWGYKPSFYSLYEGRLGPAAISYVAKYEEIPFGDPGEHRQAHSLRAGFGVRGGGRLDLGVLYEPFRVGRSFTRVDEVASGQGIGGSSFVPSRDQTRFKDAWGGQIRYRRRLPILLDEVSLRLQYLGLSAGNKKEFHTEGVRKMRGDYTGVLGFTYQAPLEDPVPFVFEGSAANRGASILTPRGRDDPFHVDWTNREARIYTLTLTYDPTPETPFYRYVQNVPEMWNLNPVENAPFSWVLKYQASHYLTATDHNYYVDACGNYIWEPPSTAGAQATRRPIHEVKSIARFNFKRGMAVAIGVSGGESLAFSSLAYNPVNGDPDKNKSITQYLDAQIRFFKEPFTTWFRYARDNWGPYSEYSDVQAEFQRSFGITVHKLFEAGGEANLGGGFLLGIRYVSVRENDNIFVPDDIGSFDEYRMSLAYRFGVEAYFRSPPSARAVQKYLTPPEVHLRIGEPLYDTSGTKARVPLHLEVVPGTASVRGEIRVFNSTGLVVGLILVPGGSLQEVLWEASGIDGTPLSAGSYTASTWVWDSEGNVARTNEPGEFELRYPSHVIAQEVPVPMGVSQPYKVEETETGLKVTFKSSVLFKVGGLELDARAKQAIDQADVLIKAYPRTNLVVEGHTDSTGSRVLNAKLSSARAQVVADYLIEKGIEPERLKVLGWGSSKPVASNSTAEGRSLNRRVEITILKTQQ